MTIDNYINYNITLSKSSNSYYLDYINFKIMVHILYNYNYIVYYSSSNTCNNDRMHFMKLYVSV